MSFASVDTLEKSKGTFVTEILIDSSITVPTVIHAMVNGLHGHCWYPDGVDVQVSNGEDLIEGYDMKWDGNDLFITIGQEYDS